LPQIPSSCTGASVSCFIGFIDCAWRFRLNCAGQRPDPLGFVFVYKATEVVNFGQGDLMMLGGFFAFTFSGMMGLNYWVGFAGAVAAMALFGIIAERIVVQPIFGYPQFSNHHGDHRARLLPALDRRHDLGH
jgi:hypothetical protein